MLISTQVPNYCDVLEAFLQDRYIRGCSVATVRTYKNTLMIFSLYCVGAAFEVNKEIVQGYIVWLRKRSLLGANAGKGQLSNVSIASYLKSLGIFLKWCYLNEWLEADYSQYCKFKKPRLPVIRILSCEEIMIVLRHAHGKYRGVIIVMLECGLRVGEVLNLRACDVHDDYILVNGKSGQRIVPISSYVRTAIDLFVNRCITYDSIKAYIWRLQQSTGIKLNAHLFRHTYATHFIMNGGDVMVLSQLLGHSSVAITQKYVHLAESYMLQKNLKYSPLSNIKNVL